MLKFYFGSVAQRIRMETAKARNHVLYFYPYLTSPTAPSIIGLANKNSCEIHTLFSVEVFASGASSLETIKYVVDKGYAVFHVPNLHAKVCTTPNFAAIGSQNLTRRGSTNREATVATIDPQVVQEVRNALSAWMSHRVPITKRMIRDMEVIVAPLANEYRKLQRRVENADRALERQNQNHLEAAARRAQSRKQRKAQREAAEARKAAEHLRRVLGSTTVSNDRRRLVLKRLAYPIDGFEHEYQDYASLLLRHRQPPLTYWHFDDGAEFLAKDNRYLIVDRTNGRLGWPRLSRTRLTRFGRGLTLTNPVEFDGTSYSLSYEFAETLRQLKHWNVAFTIAPPGKESGIILRCSFAISELSLFRTVTSRIHGSAPEYLSSFLDRIQNNEGEVLRWLLRHLLGSFKYQGNNTIGDLADAFLDGSDFGASFTLRLHKLQNLMFFSIERD